MSIEDSTTYVSLDEHFQRESWYTNQTVNFASFNHCGVFDMYSRQGFVLCLRLSSL